MIGGSTLQDSEVWGSSLCTKTQRHGLCTPALPPMHLHFDRPSDRMLGMLKGRWTVLLDGELPAFERLIRA